jgi:hypothetical protein
MIGRVLPESGRVLGIDVGYAPKKRTTAFCSLSWTRNRIDWSISCATAERRSREQALRSVAGRARPQFISVAIDGPLKPGLGACSNYRTAECVLSRGAFQTRGKPGPTNGGSGPKLHKHATMLAKMVLQDCAVESAQMPFSACSAGVYEAFPNLFLGVLCAETVYPVRPSRARRWTDCLFPLVATQLNDLIQKLLPDREVQGVESTSGHDPIAALTCAVTALAAAAGQCVAVGDPTDGYMVFPPLSIWGLSAVGERWAERELRNILCRLCTDNVGVQPPKIYQGAELLDLRKN